jgi:Na+/proline symporter
VIAAELVARVIAARSPQVAQRSALLAGGIYLAFGLIPVSIGLLGFSLLPGLAEPEQLLPLIAQEYLPPVLYMLFAGALVSAILSTVDSVLLVSASLVSHNLILPLRPGLPEHHKIRLARGGVAVFGVVAYIIALHAEGVYGLVEEASAFGSAGLFTVVVFALFTRIGGSYSAFASLLGGIMAWIGGAYLWPVSYPYLASLAVAGAAFLGTATAEHYAGSVPQRGAG